MLFASLDGSVSYFCIPCELRIIVDRKIWTNTEWHRNVALIFVCTVQNFVHCPHPYLAHGTHMVWSLYVPKALFVQVRPFRIHYSCIYVGVLFYVLKIFHGCRNQMAAFRAWKSNWVWIICCYVRPGKSVDPCLKNDVVYSEIFFWDVFDDFNGAWPWYIHKAGFAIGALVFFWGEGKLFNKKQRGHIYKGCNMCWTIWVNSLKGRPTVGWCPKKNIIIDIVVCFFVSCGKFNLTYISNNHQHHSTTNSVVRWFSDFMTKGIAKLERETFHKWILVRVIHMPHEPNMSCVLPWSS